jgi:hypothetical protein
VSLDASNKDTKLIPAVVRYLLPLKGVKVKLLDLKSVPAKTLGILRNNLVLAIKKTT